MTIKLDEFRGYLRIDKYALDDEIIRQPELFQQVCEAYVDAAADRDAAKEELEATDAKLDAHYRAQYGDQKFTETQIKSKVKLDQKHVQAFDSYLSAKEAADKLQTLKAAFEQRSYMLRDLASLFIANYYESNSMRGTDASDTAVYRRRREKLKESRGKGDA